MKIEIIINNEEVKILLKNSSKIVDKTVFPDEHNLSEKLLSEIDKLLKKNKLKPGNIKEMEVFSDQSDSFTTTRIARSVAKAFNWAVGE